MKHFILFGVFFLIIGCCGIACKKHKHAEKLIAEVENYAKQHGRLPEDMNELDSPLQFENLSYYQKKGADEYEVWYGLELGASKIYNSKTKKWRKEG